MKLEVLFQDGCVHCVLAEWHPATVSTIAPSQQIERPGAMWTTVEKIKDYLREEDKSRVKNGLEPGFTSQEDVDHFIEEMCLAEVPLEIYRDTDDNEPWRHFGTLVKEVPYDKGAYDLYMR